MSGKRRDSLTLEERIMRAALAKRRFRALVRMILANLSWLQDSDDDKLGDNVRKNIALLTRKKGKKSVLNLQDKATLNKPPEDRTPEELARIRKVLSTLKCFRRFPSEVKDALPLVLHFCYYGPDRTIVKQDHPPLRMYVILTGEVLISQSYYNALLKEMSSKDILLLGAGNYFGEDALLYEMPRMATITTTQETEFMYIDKNDFDRVLRPTIEMLWNEIRHDLMWLGYFKDWSEEELRYCGILGKKKNYEPDQIVLSSTAGEHENVHFVIKGSCNLIEHLTIKTEIQKGRNSYTLMKEVEEDPKIVEEAIKDIKKLYKRGSQAISKSNLLRPVLSLTLTSSKHWMKKTEYTKKHYIKIGTYKRLACFNVGETLENRIIIAATDLECLLLPRRYLMEKSMVTFKTIAILLSHYLPNTEKVFRTYLEAKKWRIHKHNMVINILSQQKRTTGNNIHNVPYTVRLAEDLGEF